MQEALSAEGQIYRGFTITKYLPIEEMSATLIEAVHDSSGARVIQIANDDPENLFAIALQTIPTTSNGVAHILEHTTLCGSKKYPVRDPFFSMARRSLNTYMNALTGQDFTVYVASSQVSIDFYHLFAVYLDAVFHPLLTKNSFLQEGHRLSLSSPNADLRIKGVVYNEMKGAMSSCDDRLSHLLFQNLFPDLTYAVNSGGDPKEIPTLTHKELIEFHRAFYHPSRCLFFFYGNLPLAQHLDFLSTHLLSHSHAISPLPLFEKQKRFTSPRFIQGNYPIAPSDSIQDKTVVAIGYLTTPISNQSDLLALSLIDSLLCDTDASPLKYALIQSHLAASVESIFDTEVSEAPWILTCHGCSKENAEKIFPLAQEILKELSQKGFDPQAIAASLHQLEFERTEIGGGKIPFGLNLFFRSILPSFHGVEPELALLIHSLFDELKTRLKDPNYLGNLLRQYWIDNPHIVHVILEPDPELLKREEKEETERLSQIRKKLSASEIEAIIHTEKELTESQDMLEGQSMDCLPKITLGDIPHHAKDFALQKKSLPSLDFFHHNCFTNRIAYADIHIDLPSIDRADLSSLSLFTEFWTQIGCGKRNYIEMLQWHQSALGHISANLSLHPVFQKKNECRPTVSIRAKALERNIPSLLEITYETLFESNFHDSSRLQELLIDLSTDLESSIIHNAMNYTSLLATRSLSYPSMLQEELYGLSFYQFVKSKNKNKLDALIDHFDRLKETIFTSPSSSLVASCDEFSAQCLAKFPAFPSSFSKALPKPAWHSDSLSLSSPHQGKIIASPVAFTTLAFLTETDAHPDSAALWITSHLLENRVLHRLIREKGGAYGAGAAYSSATGVFSFYAYRDPHIASTYFAFQKAIEEIGSGRFSEEDLFEAKLGILQGVDAPVPVRQRANLAFSWQKSSRSFATRDAYRHSIISASREDVIKVVQAHLLSKKEKGIFVTLASKDLLQNEALALPFALQISSI